jgi:hypothetical protein
VPHILIKLGVHPQLQALVLTLRYGVVKIPKTNNILVCRTMSLLSALGAILSLLAYY